MGPVIEVSAVYATEDHKIEVEDTAVAVLRFTSGAVGTIVSSTAVFPGFAQRLEVSGTGGTVVVEDGQIVRSAFTSDSPDPGLRGNRLPRPASAEGAAANAAALGVASHAAQIADLLTAVEQGREPSVTGRDGRDTLEVVLAVYESSREGRPVVLLDATRADETGRRPRP
jgi:predicted dehydrogenase